VLVTGQHDASIELYNQQCDMTIPVGVLNMHLNIVVTNDDGEIKDESDCSVNIPSQLIDAQVPIFASNLQHLKCELSNGLRRSRVSEQCQ